MTAARAEPSACTVYYDGACPVCSREIGFYRGRAGESGAVFIDVARGDGAPAPDLTREAALARFHVRLPDGRLVSGARAFLALWAVTPGFRLAARVLSLPPLPWMLEGGYRGFLRLRRAWRPGPRT
jgi:predicted DCC family thiol-disulfide oxidoreductase YuxK